MFLVTHCCSIGPFIFIFNFSKLAFLLNLLIGASDKEVGNISVAHWPATAEMVWH